MQSPHLHISSKLTGNVSDIHRMVNHVSSPSPRLSSCPLFPVQVLSICLCGSNVLATALLISKPPYKVWEERAKPWEGPTSLFPLFTQTLGAHRHGKPTLSDFLHELQKNLHCLLAELIIANLFYSLHGLSVLRWRMDTVYPQLCFTIKQAIWSWNIFIAISLKAVVNVCVWFSTSVMFI